MGAHLVWVGFGVAFALSAVMGWAVLRMGRRLGFVDEPDDDLKTHTGRPVPLGGVAVFVGMHAGLALAGAVDVGLVLATVTVLVVGLVDDRRGLSPVSRLIGAGVSGLMLVGFSDVVSGPLAWVAGVALVVVLLNAVNLFDGLDALASSVCGVAALGIALYGALSGVASPMLPLTLVAALAGILLYNWPPARLYLGDNGAYVVGVSLAWAILRLSVTGWSGALVAASLVGLPLIDLLVTVTRRARAGNRLFAGDRDHTYDRLHRALGSVAAVAVVAVIAQVVWMGVIIATDAWWGEPRAVVVALVLGLASVVFGSATA